MKLYKPSGPVSQIQIQIFIIMHPESLTELIYLHILNTSRGYLHIRSFRRIQFSAFRYKLARNGFAALKHFRETDLTA